MSLIKLYKSELYKYIKKPITLVLLITLVLPVFYGISTAQNASYVEVQGDFDALLFASINWNMLTMTGVPEVLFGLVATHIFAYEIERGQIRTLLVKVCDRTKLIISKVLVQMTLIVGIYVLFYLVSFLVYYTIIVKTPLGNGSFGSIENLHFSIMDLIYLIQILLISNVVFLLGLYYKAFTSFMIGIGITVTFMFLEYFPVIKYFITSYTATALSYSQISAIQALLLNCLFLVVAFLPTFFIIRRFKEIDIK